MKVLIAEDDPFVRDIAVAQLEDAGFEVIDAADGGQALKLLQTVITVDALLADIRMPEAQWLGGGQGLPQAFP